MNRKFVSQFLFASSIGLGGYFIGQHSERRKCFEIESDLENKFHKYFSTTTINDDRGKLRPLPGLPIFGTVSAAVPAPTSKDYAIEKQKRISQIMQFGFPGFDNIRSFDDYVLSYDRRNRVAHWVFEHLTAETVRHNDEVDRSKCDFVEDESIHVLFRSTNADYKRSGFDRGHLAAAGNHKHSQRHIEETFRLSNMAPQVGQGFNRDSWNKLERYVRKLTKTHINVYVCTGPLYLPKKEADGKKYIKYQVIGDNNVAVPTHFYKIVVAETPDHKLEMEAYVMPNQVIDDSTPLQAFQVPPESVERAAGLLFFDKLSRKQLAKVNGKNV